MSTRFLDIRLLPPVPPKCCLLCAAPLTGQQRRWCRKCASFANFLQSGGAQRRAVFRRDRGVCAKCGTDTEKLEKANKWTSSTWHSWEADHIVPVVEGGGYRHGMTQEDVLANLRTLCIPCHGAETRALASRRAAARREAVQPSLIGAT